VVDWLVYEYMYAMSRSASFTKLKPRFSWLWNIKSMKFIQPIKMGSFSAIFDVLAYNNQDQLSSLMRIESKVDEETLSNIISDIRHVKNERPQDDIQSGVLVALHPLSEATIQQFQRLTNKPGNLPFLNFSDAYRGYVKMGWNKGFYLYLAEMTETGLRLVAPELPVEH